MDIPTGLDGREGLNPRDTIFAFGFITWEDGEPGSGVASAVAARHLIHALGEDERVGRVLVADPFRSAAAYFAKRRWRARRTFPAAAGLSLYQPLRLSRREPLDATTASRTYAAYDARLARRAGSAGMDAPALITTNPLLAGFADLGWAGPVTYYCRDDYSAAYTPGHEPRRDLFAEAFARIGARGHRVVAVSRRLLEVIAPTGPATVVPNGISAEQWSDLGTPPTEIAALPAPRIVYCGGLDRRIDVAKVTAIAARFPDGSVLLVGRQLEPEVLAPLGGLPNVHVLPSLPRHELTRVVGACDAGIVPHVVNSATLAMSPLKLYEYLAAGLPVAAVDMESMRGIDERVVLAADDAGAFAEGVATALGYGRLPEDERRRRLQDHSWSVRFRELIDFALRPAARSPAART